jgi:hypothetical protein
MTDPYAVWQRRFNLSAALTADLVAPGGQPRPCAGSAGSEQAIEIARRWFQAPAPVHAPVPVGSVGPEQAVEIAWLAIAPVAAAPVPHTPYAHRRALGARRGRIRGCSRPRRTSATWQRMVEAGKAMNSRQRRSAS